MTTTCVACNITNNGMISIYNHPNNLDSMLNFVSGHQVEADDYLCIICYDELKVAFNFKQKCQQSPLYRSTSEVRNVSFKIEPLTSSEIPSSSCNSERHISAVEENDAKITTTIVDEEDASELDESQDSHRYNTQRSPQNTRYISGDHGELSPEDEYIVEVIDHQEFPLDISDKEDLDMTLSKNEQEDNIQNDDKDSIDIIKCEVCDKLFTKIESHRRHLYRQHSIGKRGKRIPRDEHRKGPIPNYEEDDLFKNLGTTQCEYCFIILSTYEERKQHETKHKDEDRPYRCNNEDCSARFKDRYSVRNHIRIHSDFKQYKCRFCDQRFHQRGNAKAHERCHTGEKPFVCPHCGKGFAEKGNLKSHIRFHTGERPYSCSHCSKTFRTHYSHKIHVRSHTQEKPFSCSDCGKSFNCSGKLRIHKRIHTGHRPYMCDLCGASFMDSSRLKRHTKIH